MSFGETLRALIEERGMTQKELTARFNVAPSTLSCYVQGTREPEYATLLRLADYFGVSVDYLLGHHGNAGETRQEELLRVFRNLTPAQREVYLDQGKAFLRLNARQTKPSSGSISGGGERAG